ncbi:lactate utilization protein B [Bacteroidota bacterium]
MDRIKKFKKKSEKVSFDNKHRQIIKYNMSKYEEAVDENRKSYKDIEIAKDYVSAIKDEAIKNLDKYLLEFEEKFKSNGGRVIWARDSEEAIKEIKTILGNNKRLIVKSKSMTTEEIGFNEALENINKESVETDLGEFIVQIAGEPPYHIVTPAMHKSKEDISELYNEKFNTPENSSPEFLTEYTRKYLREKFINADVGVTGANFLVADVGGIALTENEGNALMSTSFPDTHIVIAGIEKVIPSIENLGIIWPLLAANGTGQRLSAYNSVITGPGKIDEKDGPGEMIVVLLDNGRTKIYENKKQKTALKCIRCGACLNYCPVYKNIGGYTYDAVYTGPIGKVINPHLNISANNDHLSFASTLCGKCSEICPVKIELHKLLIYNRKEVIEKTERAFSEKTIMKILKITLSKRKFLNFRFLGLKSGLLKIVGGKLWGPRRKFPAFSKKSFSQMWEERQRNSY